VQLYLHTLKILSANSGMSHHDGHIVYGLVEPTYFKTQWCKEKELNVGEIVAIIPAQGGSKGLVGKNLRPISGQPLVAWSV
jgi:hypothetical protein